MDSATKTTSASDYRTPPRILIPKLVCSRDKWKAKATTRKRLLHKEKIRSRDLSFSRQWWKDRALLAEQQLQQLQQQLQANQGELAQTRADIAELQQGAQKN